VEIGDTCMKIRKIGKPQRTLKEPDMTDYEVEVINCLNKVESKLEWYASHVRE